VPAATALSSGRDSRPRFSRDVCRHSCRHRTFSGPFPCSSWFSSVMAVFPILQSSRFCVFYDASHRIEFWRIDRAVATASSCDRLSVACGLESATTQVARHPAGDRCTVTGPQSAASQVAPAPNVCVGRASEQASPRRSGCQNATNGNSGSTPRYTCPIVSKRPSETKPWWRTVCASRK